jgi:hypothetical protein
MASGLMLTTARRRSRAPNPLLVGTVVQLSPWCSNPGGGSSLQVALMESDPSASTCSRLMSHCVLSLAESNVGSKARTMHGMRTAEMERMDEAKRLVE